MYFRKYININIKQKNRLGTKQGNDLSSNRISERRVNHIRCWIYNMRCHRPQHSAMLMATTFLTRRLRPLFLSLNIYIISVLKGESTTSLQRKKDSGRWIIAYEPTLKKVKISFSVWKVMVRVLGIAMALNLMRLTTKKEYYASLFNKLQAQHLRGKGCI